MILVFRFWFLTGAALKGLITLAALELVAFQLILPLLTVLLFLLLLTWMGVFSTSPFSTFKRGQTLGFCEWLIGPCMELGSLFWKRSLLSLSVSEHVFLGRFMDFRGALTWMVMGHLSWFLWTQITPVFFSHAHILFLIVVPADLQSWSLSEGGLS